MTRFGDGSVLLVLWFGLLGNTVAEQAYSTRPQENVVEPFEWKTLELPPPALNGDSVEPKPDEQPLWDMLAAHSLTKLRQRLVELRAQYPGWQPPEELMDLLAAGELEHRIDSMIDAQDDEALLAQYEKLPNAFGCDHILRGWAVTAARIRRRDIAGAVSHYADLLSNCTGELDWFATLYDAHKNLNANAFDELLRSQQQWPEALRAHVQTQDLIIQHQLRQITALGLESIADARARIVMISPAIIEHRRGAAARQLGWLFYQSRAFSEAEFWFRQSMHFNADEESAYGATLALIGMGDLASARTAAHEQRWASVRMRELYRDILVARALDAQRSADYAASAALYSEAESYATLSPENQLARAWNAFQLRRFTEAAALFIPLYLARRDDDSARGTFFSLQRSRQDKTLLRLIDTTDGPLDGLVSAEKSMSLLFAKRYRTAVASGVLLPAPLVNVDSPRLTFAGMWREREGESGLGKMSLMQLPIADGRWQQGRHLMDLRLERLQLDSGRPGPGALTGTVPVEPRPFDVAIDSEIDAGTEWQAAYTYLDDWEWNVAIGDTPWLSPLDRGPLLALGVRRHDRQDRINWSAVIRRDSVRDSMLSYIGQRDPYSGTAWGGVTTTGVDFELHADIGAHWSLGFDFNRARLEGEHVPENNSLGMRLQFDRALRPARQRSAVAGPYVEYRSFERNLSFFTFGHGGYFSPQHLAGAGIAASYSTADARRSVFRAHADIGYQEFEQAQAPYLPLAPDGRTYRRSQDTHTLVRFEVKGVYKLTAHWIVGAAAAYLDAPAARDQSFGLFVTYSLKPRASAIGADLPDFMFDAAY